ncbi:MAG: hypothetical protein ACK5NY_02940 [Burkholderiaceae bacterium]
MACPPVLAQKNIVKPSAAAPLPIEKRSPEIRADPLVAAAPTGTDWRTLEAFTDQTLLLSKTQGEKAGLVLKSLGDRVLIGEGDVFLALVDGVAVGHRVSVIKHRQPIRLNDGEVLGYSAEIAGVAEVVELGDVVTLRLLKSYSDVLVGAGVVSAAVENHIGIQPKPAPVGTAGQIAAILGLHPVAVNGSIVAVALPLGSSLQRGELLNILQPGELMSLSEYGKPPVKLPDQVVARGIVLSGQGRTALVFLQKASTEIRVGQPVVGAAP